MQTIYSQAASSSNGPLADVVNINHNDGRPESLSHGMIIAAQFDKKAEFDAIWDWPNACLYVTETNHPACGFFAWQARTSACGRR